MILTEYNEELHIRSEKQLSYEEGKEAGIRACVLNMLQAGLKAEQIISLTGITEKELKQYMAAP